MSEKRFIVESVMIDCLCKDEPRIAKVITDTDENYSYEELYEVAELLNEQQTTIKQQDIEIKNLNLHIGKLVDGSEISQQLMKEYEKNDKLEAKIESMTEQHKARLDKLIEEIGELQMKNVEQQATIRRLQDLCGESDSGNAKLRIENKKLKEENEQLRQSVEYWQKKYEEGTETFQID